MSDRPPQQPQRQRQVLEADCTWTGKAFEGGVQVAIDRDGRIDAVGALGLRPTRRLERRALVPGMVNAHSHAFQRGLRGRGESFPRGVGSFWTWRAAMYELVESLGADQFFEITRSAFCEMRAAGITSVGEFHYLHHNPDQEDFAFDLLVLRAAAEAGIRLALLNVHYRTGGIGTPLEAAQRRFKTDTPEAFWRQMDRLAGRLEGPAQTLGAAAHSIRAAEPDEIAHLYREARRRGQVFHIHLEEQRLEVEAARAAYGKNPLALVLDRLDDLEGFTAVHCTHSEPTELGLLAARGGRVCVCPLTEANLGDGIPSLTALPGQSLCLGTDSNSRLSMLEEMRWLEYVQRLAGESRGVLIDETGAVAPRLLEIATVGGAESLGLDCGAIAPGLWADLAVVDLDHGSLAGVEQEALAGAFVLGAGEVIVETCVGGLWKDHR